MKTKNRVIVVYAQWASAPTGCEIYRGNMPMHFLGENSNWETQWVSLGDVWKDCQNRGFAASDAFVNSADVFVFPRMFLSDEESVQMYGSLFALLRQNNKRIVYELDDDLTNEYRVVVDGDAITPAKWADAITCTTPFLAARMKRLTGRPVYVLPNAVAPSTWQGGDVVRPAALDDKYVIGLTGSLSHAHDWEVLKTVIPTVLANNPSVEFLIMGFYPDYLANLPRTKYMPPMDYMRYAQIIRMCDMILAPVDPLDNFNLSKSPIKVIEGMAAKRTRYGRDMGAAVIASDTPVYRLAIKHEVTGLLTDHTPAAWYASIQRLLDDPALRTKLQMNGYNWVYKHHSMASEWRSWAQAYTKILAAPQNPLPLPYMHT